MTIDPDDIPDDSRDPKEIAARLEEFDRAWQRWEHVVKRMVTSLTPEERAVLQKRFGVPIEEAPAETEALDGGFPTGPLPGGPTKYLRSPSGPKRFGEEDAQAPLRVRTSTLAILDELGMPHAGVPRQVFAVKASDALPVQQGPGFLSLLEETLAETEATSIDDTDDPSGTRGDETP